jgi:hypothetical protein
MLDRIRSRAFQVLRPGRGDRLAPLKRAVLRANDALGRPLAPQSELAERRAWEAGILGQAPGDRGEARGKEPAPVVIFHLDKHQRLVGKMTDVLKGAGIAYSVRNVDGDEPATEAALRDAGKYGLPFVMVGPHVIGGVEELADADHNGELRKLVWS